MADAADIYGHLHRTELPCPQMGRSGNLCNSVPAPARAVSPRCGRAAWHRSKAEYEKIKHAALSTLDEDSKNEGTCMMASKPPRQENGGGQAQSQNREHRQQHHHRKKMRSARRIMEELYYAVNDLCSSDARCILEDLLPSDFDNDDEYYHNKYGEGRLFEHDSKCDTSATSDTISTSASLNIIAGPSNVVGYNYMETTKGGERTTATRTTFAPRPCDVRYNKLVVGPIRDVTAPAKPSGTNFDTAPISSSQSPSPSPSPSPSLSPTPLISHIPPQPPLPFVPPKEIITTRTTSTVTSTTLPNQDPTTTSKSSTGLLKAKNPTAIPELGGKQCKQNRASAATAAKTSNTLAAPGSGDSPTAPPLGERRSRKKTSTKNKLQSLWKPKRIFKPFMGSDGNNKENEYRGHKKRAMRSNEKYDQQEEGEILSNVQVVVTFGSDS